MERHPTGSTQPPWRRRRIPINAVAVPTLPNVADARLPATYEAARAAIAQCEQVDECKTWADKAAALASYARQAKDDSLRVMAVRIQARAERRLGQLLKQIPNSSVTHLKQNRREGALPSVTRVSAATAAGVSEHQRKQAMRIASIPAEDFNLQIESESPPTITHLAEQGTVPRAIAAVGYAPDPRQAARVFKAFQTFAVFCGENDPVTVAKAFGQQDTERLRGVVTALDNWLDRFVTNLGSEF